MERIKSFLTFFIPFLIFFFYFTNQNTHNHSSANSTNDHMAHDFVEIPDGYGEYYNLGSLKKGKNEIKVTLHSNNHGALVYKGKAIQASKIVDVSNE